MWNRFCDRWNAVITEKRFGTIFMGLIFLALVLDQGGTPHGVVCLTGFLLMVMEALAVRNRRRRKRHEDAAATLSARDEGAASPRPR